MEIISLIIIIALLLSSCTTDERGEEIAVFQKNPDLDQWHNRQHLWMMHQKEKKRTIRSENHKTKSPSQAQMRTKHSEEEFILKTYATANQTSSFKNQSENDHMQYQEEEAVLETY